MYYTGIDLHKKTSFITTIDAGGKIITRANLQNVEEDILAYFSTLREETKIVIESMKGGRSCFFAFLSGHGAWRLKEKKLHPLRFRRNGAPSTYRSVSDCLSDGEGHPRSPVNLLPRYGSVKNAVLLGINELAANRQKSEVRLEIADCGLEN